MSGDDWDCLACHDTHEMTLHRENGDEQTVMCTRCPVPCPKCRGAMGKSAFCATSPCPCTCHAPLYLGPLVYRPMSDDVRASLIAFARKTWWNNGAEGETVHRLCDELEHYAALATAGKPSP